MNSPEIIPDGEDSLWVLRNLDEESERVERHLEMAREMLADKEDGQDTVCRISFSRILSHDTMMTLMPGEQMGTLLGIEEVEEPVFIVGNFKVFVYFWEGNDRDGDPDFETVLYESDLERIPVREINELYGATAIPDAWSHLDSLPDSD